MEINNYECIIVGAGPAGISAAYYLIKNGIKKICILERHGKHYHKPCAGLVTKKANKILKEMGIDLKKELDYFEMKNLNVFYGKRLSFHMDINYNKDDYHWLSSYYPNRENLDNLLRKKIEDMGVEIFYNTLIDDVDNEKVITSKEIFKFKNIIFADGYNGYSKKYNIEDKKKNFLAEVILEEHNNAKDFVNIVFNITKKGYAWYGSTGKYINIGLTDEYNKNIDYVQKLKKFSKSLGYEINAKMIKGAFIPCGVRKKITVGSNCYLVGDAAGLTDPFTVEGIYYALITGKYSALSILNNNMQDYIDNTKKIVNNFNYILKFKNIFFSRLVQKVLWNHFAKKHFKFITYAWYKIIIEGKYGYNEIIKCHKDYKKNVISD